MTMVDNHFMTLICFHGLELLKLKPDCSECVPSLAN